MYVLGQYISQDFKQAFHWSKKAAEQGFVIAQTNLGEMYYHGRGIPQSYKEAFPLV